MNVLIQVLLGFALATLVMLLWLTVCAFRKHALWGLTVLLFSPVSAIAFGIRHWREARIPFIAFSASLLSVVSLSVYLLHTSGTWEMAQTSMHIHRAILSKHLTDQDALRFVPANLVRFNELSAEQRSQGKLDLMTSFIDSYEPALTDADRDEISLVISRLMYGSTMTHTQKQELRQLRDRVELTLPVTPAEKAPIEEQNASTVERFTRPSKHKPPRQNYRLEYLPIKPGEARDFVGKMFKVTRTDGIEKQYKLVGGSPGALRFERRIPGGRYSFEYKYQDIEKLRILAQVIY